MNPARVHHAAGRRGGKCLHARRAWAYQPGAHDERVAGGSAPAAAAGDKVVGTVAQPPAEQEGACVIIARRRQRRTRCFQLDSGQEVARGPRIMSQ
jgi:hypothetical protein